MRVTRDESPKNEKYFIIEKGEAFDQFNGLSHSVRAPPPSVRQSNSARRKFSWWNMYTHSRCFFLLLLLFSCNITMADSKINLPRRFLFTNTQLWVLPPHPHTPPLVSVFTVQSGTDGPPRPDPGRSKRLQQYLIYDNCVGGRRRRRQPSSE
jgi:hypothetical protein